MSTALHITVAEYDAMIARGAFEDIRGRRIELINGELREMSPQGPWHGNTVMLLQKWSHGLINDSQAEIRVQLPISLPEFDSEPEPDVAWVKPKSYRQAHPDAGDALLIIEVALASLTVDLREGAQLYAHAGIPEYWVVDLANRQVHVHRDPSTSGYRVVQRHRKGETIHPLAFPNAALDLNALFGEEEV